jgi:hypothetical protein
VLSNGVAENERYIKPFLLGNDCKEVLTSAIFSETAMKYFITELRETTCTIGCTSLQNFRWLLIFTRFFHFGHRVHHCRKKQISADVIETKHWSS